MFSEDPGFIPGLHADTSAPVVVKNGILLCVGGTGTLPRADALVTTPLVASEVVTPQQTNATVEIAPGVRLLFLSAGIGDRSIWVEAGGRGLDTAFIYGDADQKDTGEVCKECNVGDRYDWTTPTGLGVTAVPGRPGSRQGLRFEGSITV